MTASNACFRDLRFALRLLAKTPGFAGVAVLMLALGIGSVTAMFSIVRAMVLHPFSSPNAERLVILWSSDNATVSTLDYLDLREQTTWFAELSAYTLQRINLGGDHPEIVQSAFCTPGLLRAFGVAPALGRWLEEDDERKGAPPVAVISHRLWQQSFAGDQSVIGRPIRLNGASVIVVGVMPATFDFCSPWMWPSFCDVWRPLQLQREEISRDTGWWLVVGCLKPGVSLAAANAEVQAIGARLKAAHPNTNAKKPFLVHSLRYEMTRYGSANLWMVFGAAALILAAACANVASMLLARSARRHGEFGVRMALGAGPGQIFRLALSEGLVLALAGTVAGAGLAAAGLRGIEYIAVLPQARLAALALDGYTLAFAAGLSLLTGLAAGLLPALATSHMSASDLLRTDNRSAVGSKSLLRLLRGLVATQVAVAFVLANLAVLLSASYARVLAVNAGVSSEFVLCGELNLCGPRYERNEVLTRFCEELAQRAAALPGVTAAGTTSQLPLQGGANRSILVNDETFDPNAERTVAECSEITPGYFAASGMRLLRGRTLQQVGVGDRDSEVVINQSLADKCWPGQDPLGKIIRVNAPVPWFRVQVVGVVESIRRSALEAKPPPQMYWTGTRAWGRTHYLLVHTSRPAGALTPLLRELLADMDPDLPLAHIRTLKTLVRDATQDVRLICNVMNVCMGVAIALVAIGLYGTLSYHMSRRTREMGVRLAIGATRGDVVRLVFQQGFGWVLVGLLLGAGGALLAARILRALLYDINPLNPMALVVAALAVTVAAALACWLPAFRAARTDPMEALRCE